MAFFSLFDFLSKAERSTFDYFATQVDEKSWLWICIQVSNTQQN